MTPRTPIVLPVRFAVGDGQVQTTTRELSLEGAFIHCLAPPPAGTELQLKLYLPGTSLAEEIVARVRDPVEGGTECGFWAEFVSGNPHSRARIARLLRPGKPTVGEAAPEEKVAIGAVDVRRGPASVPTEGANRRSSPRYTARFAVRFATVQDFILEYAANISAGGVFVRTDSPPSMGSVVQVSLDLPGGGLPPNVKALVVHRVTPEQARERDTMAGVGVQFIEVSDAFRERLDRAISHILGEDAPHTGILVQP